MTLQYPATDRFTSVPLVVAGFTSYRTILQHFDDLAQFIGQLSGQPLAKLVGKPAIVPERFLARLAKAGPDAFADIWLSKIAKNCPGIVNLIGKRDAQNVIVRGVEMGEIGFLSFLPVRLPLAFGCVCKAVRACCHHARNTITEPVTDIVQPPLTP
jgi:hypothetical protein